MRAAANAVLIADEPCSQGENAGFTRDKDYLLGDHPRILYGKKHFMFPDTQFLSEKVDIQIEENRQKCCFLWTLGNYGEDLGDQRSKFHSSGIRGLKKVVNLGNLVTGASQVSKYPVYEHKI